MKSLLRITFLALKKIRLASLTVTFTLVQCCLKLWLPMLMARIVNTGVLEKNYSYACRTGWLMITVCFGAGASGYAAGLCCAAMIQSTALELREKAYRSLIDMTIEQADHFGIGSLITRLTSDIDSCAMFIYAVILFAFEPALMVSGGCLMMWRITPGFGLIITGVGLLQLILIVFFIRSSAPAFLKIRKMMDKLNGRLGEIFRLFRLIKASNSETASEEDFEETSRSLFEAQIDARMRMALFDPFIMLFINLGVGAVLLLAGGEVSRGTMQIGLVMSGISYTEQILMSMASGGRIVKAAAEARPCAERLCEVLDTKPGMNLKDTVSYPGGFKELVLDHVSCHYPSGPDILKEINFKISSGEFVAVIGRTGSGKSTLAGLCARLFDPSSGKVWLDGRDIREWNPEDVHRAVGLTEKHNAILEGSVLDNIIFGREGISMEDALHSAYEAELSEYLDKAGGGIYGSAMHLSGGERQRLSMARILAGRPGLLIIDDGTSSMDFPTEGRLISTLRENHPSMAVLLLTNRMASAARADRILILEGGGIAAEGTDSSLFRNNEWYRTMWASQGGRETCF